MRKDVKEKERAKQNKSKNKNFRWNEENAYEVHWRQEETINIKDVDAKHMTHSYNEFEGKWRCWKRKRKCTYQREVGQTLIAKACCRTFYEKRSTC